MNRIEFLGASKGSDLRCNLEERRQKSLSRGAESMKEREPEKTPMSNKKKGKGNVKMAQKYSI